MNPSTDTINSLNRRRAERLPWSTCAPLLILFSLLGWVVLSLPVLAAVGVL